MKNDIKKNLTKTIINPTALPADVVIQKKNKSSHSKKKENLKAKIRQLEEEQFIIFEFYQITEKTANLVNIGYFLFFLILPIFVALLYQFVWSIKCMSFLSFLQNKELKKNIRKWCILGFIFLPIIPIFVVKSKIRKYIMNLSQKSIPIEIEENPLVEDTGYIENKNIPHLSEEEASSHYIICHKIDKSIKSLAFSSDILHSIDLFIDKGDIVVILGPSGSGKTTLLNIMAGVDKPTNGQVYIDGKCITDMNDKNITLFRKEEISYIYQRYGLIPILSVFDNIRIGQELVKKSDRNVDINDLISTMGLTDLLEKFPHELSGGQKQRVSIARAIAKQPNVMFCDEPTGALDKENAKMIIDLFLKLNDKFKTTIIIVTHDNNLVENANKVIHLRDGKIWKTEIIDRQKKIKEIA